MVSADAYRTALLGYARAELAANVAEEPPGSHRSSMVDLYLSGCVRNGRRLGLRGTAWCAAFASWCAWQAWAAANETDAAPAALGWKPDVRSHAGTSGGLLVLGASGPLVILPPIGYRAAVSELVADARACGAWHEVAAYEPLPGDLCVMGRGGQDPRLGGDGHVAVVDEAADPPAVSGIAFWTIGGNEDHAVRRTLRCVCHAPGVGPAEPVLGFVAVGASLG